MAKIQEETIVITISRLLRNIEKESPMFSDETVASIEEVIKELLGKDTLIEIQKP